MRQGVKKSLERVLALLISILLVLSHVQGGGPLSIYAEDDPQAGSPATNYSATISGTSNQNGYDIDWTRTLTYLGGRDYALDIQMSASYEKVFKNTNRKIVQNDYVEIEQTGYYLVQLWGGKGGDGQATNESYGGKGGQGAYLKGYLRLEKGQILYSSLGGNGGTSASSGEGGGANSGGGHGPSGSYSVGGGGGYSALYLFTNTNLSSFRSKYVRADGSLKTLDEGDRTTKYILIAGGGGGGGAGNQRFYPSVHEPDGGDAGVPGGPQGVLGVNVVVPGIFYAGRNGKSSGSSTAYIGRGGSNYPGGAPHTVLGAVEAEKPNDWPGSYNSNLPGGAGGDGNLRGGGGGAGFCGGSGGVMQSLIVGANVGGGGGGSSFIASVVQESEGMTSIQVGNPSETGGAFVLTYLGQEEGVQEDTDHLNNAQLTIPLSEYFEAVDNAEFPILLTGKNLKEGFSEKILIRAKDDFPGGNKVPLLDGKIHVQTTANGDQGLSYELDVYAGTDEVNVPLDFVLKGKILARQAPVNVPKSELYDDPYKLIRNELSGSYKFIDGISHIKVYDATGESEITTTYLAPGVSTRYTLKMTVIPKDKNGYAVVGPKQYEKPYTAQAAINVTEENEISFGEDDLSMKVMKELTMVDDDTFILTLKLQDVVKENVLAPSDIESVTFKYGTSQYQTVSFFAQHAGTYGIQAWGANGGNGGRAYIKGAVLGSWDAEGFGGAFGDGGYSYGCLHLDENEALTAFLGKNGEDGQGDVTKQGYGQVAKGQGGKGGQPSYIKKSDDTLLLVAGGGGGGGGGAAARANFPVLQKAQKDGNSGYNAAALVDELPDNLDEFYGSNGGAGQATTSPSATGGQGGGAGYNYVANDLDCNSYDLPNPVDMNVAVHGGAVRISCLSLDYEDRDNAAKLFGLSFDFLLSRYFNVDWDEVTVQIGDKDCTFEKVSPLDEGTHDIKITIFNIDCEGLQNEVQDREVEVKNATINIVLKRKEGFIGGNDVPVLGTSLEPLTGLMITRGEEHQTVDPCDSSDYANVPLKFTFAETGHDPIITCGDSVPHERANDRGLFTYGSILPSGNDAWKRQFVNDLAYSMEPEGAVAPGPHETTSYLMRTTLSPLSLPLKAEVGPPVEDISKEVSATVYVRYKVTTAGSQYVTITGPTELDSGQGYSGHIEPDEGYKLPASIAVKVGGIDLAADQYTYDQSTGILTIKPSAITCNVEIVAIGQVLTYQIRFYTPKEPLEPDEDITFIELTSEGGPPFEFEKDATIGDAVTFANTHANGVSPPEGHEFYWDWPLEGDSQNWKMPGHDLLIYGDYRKKPCQLTVNYVYNEGETLIPGIDPNPLIVNAWYGDPYTLIYPDVPGYAPIDRINEPITVTSDETRKIKYEAIFGKLFIYYIKSDTNELIGSHSVDVQSGINYSVNLSDAGVENIAGYLPRAVEGVVSEDGVVSGTMGDMGRAVTVYFDPMEIEIEFVGGDECLCNLPIFTVLYNNIYGYSKMQGEENFAYSGLPSPMTVGHRFEGWYLDEYHSEVSKIEDDTKVLSLPDPPDSRITLYAKWEAETFQLTVNYWKVDHQGLPHLYVFPEGTPNTPDSNPLKFSNLEQGNTINIEAPDPELGYYLQAFEETVTMPASNRVVNIYYRPVPIYLTIHYRYFDGEPATSSFYKTFYWDRLGDWSNHDDKTRIYVSPLPIIEGYAPP